MSLAGGILQNGYQCGMLWGAAFAAGARAYQLLGPGPQAETEAIHASQRLVSAFRARTKNAIDCGEIIKMDFRGKNQIVPILKFFARGGPVGCFHLTARYAPDVHNGINASLSSDGKSAHPLDTPVSCASMLVQKMGASAVHATMAAGLAGGIGLSGGGCGALGAAIWMIEMEGLRLESSRADIDARSAAALERFLESSDYEFECAKITGQTFDHPAAHAEYVRAGGCTKVIDALAA